MTQPYIVIIDYQVLPRITHCAFMGLSGRWGCFPASRGACEGYVAQCPMAVVSVGKRNSAAPVQSRRTSLQCAFALDQLVAPQNRYICWPHRRLHHSGTWCSCGCIYYSFHRCFLWAKREILYIFKFTDKLHGIIYLTKSFNKITK